MRDTTFSLKTGGNRRLRLMGAMIVVRRPDIVDMQIVKARIDLTAETTSTRLLWGEFMAAAILVLILALLVDRRKT